MPDVPVVVLGSGAVGKSCITIQYIQGHFVDKYDATIEDVYRKPVEIDGQSSVLTIVDTAGQDAFGTIRDQYLKRGQGFLLVYSIADAESFQQLKRIYAQLLRTKGDANQMQCVVVGNKLDLSAQRAVSFDEGKLFATHAKSPFVEISAKNRAQVEDVFTTLVRNIRDKGSAGTQQSSAPQGRGGADGGASGSASGGTGKESRDASQGQQSGSQSTSASSSSVPQPKKEKKKFCVML